MSLGDILETEIQGEITRIREQAQAQAQQLVTEAQERAQTLLDSRKRALESDHAAAITRARSAADLEGNAQRLAAADTLQVQAFQIAEQQLRSVTSQPEYSEILKRLIREAHDALPQADTVEAHPNEVAAVQGALSLLGLNMQVKANDQIATGVRLLGQGGKTSVQNTLVGRLNSGRSALQGQVARLLAQSAQS